MVYTVHKVAQMLVVVEVGIIAHHRCLGWYYEGDMNKTIHPSGRYRSILCLC